MAGIRKAFVWASVGRYVIVIINLASTVIIARLLTPKEYGISVLGISVLAIAEALRELGGGAYLVQQGELPHRTIRTTITVSLMVTIAVTTLLASLARPLAGYFAVPELERYLQVAAFGYLMGPYMYPIFAMMSRELAFGPLTFISAIMALLNAATSIVLAYLGFSYMSFAWASVTSAFAGTWLCFYFYRDISIYWPSLSNWRGVVRFGAYDSATAVLYRIGEAIAYMIFGRLLNAESVGLFQRALLICLFPERVILAGVGAVALPAFSKTVRDGHDLKINYLATIEHITAVQWPALVFLALTAHPIVYILLGRQWLEVIPLIQVLSVALVFSFPLGLQYPTLVAVGAVRYMPPLVFIQTAISMFLLWLSAGYGIHVAALSMVAAIPLNALLSIFLVRRYVHFHWSKLASALKKSLALSALSAIGPVAVVFNAGWHLDLSGGAAFVAMILFAFGWICGLWLTRHPLLQEVFRARDALIKFTLVAKALGIASRLLGHRQ